MRASWRTAGVIALVSMATVARAQGSQVMGVSAGGGPGRMLADFGDGFETGYVIDTAISFQKQRVGIDFYFVFQDNPATSQRNVEASARNGQDTKVSFSNGGGGVRIRYLYPGLDSFVSVYGEAGAGVNFSSFTHEIAGERQDDPVTFGVEGLAGAGVSFNVVPKLSLALGGLIRQAATTERPLTCIGATGGLTLWFR